MSFASCLHGGISEYGELAEYRRRRYEWLTFRKNTTSELVIQLAVSCIISSSPFPAKICISSAIFEAIAKQASSRRGSGRMTRMGTEGVSYRYRFMINMKSRIDQRRTCSPC
jgi:hypothetical protein